MRFRVEPVPRAMSKRLEPPTEASPVSCRFVKVLISEVAPLLTMAPKPPTPVPAR